MGAEKLERGRLAAVDGKAMNPEPAKTSKFERAWVTAASLAAILVKSPVAALTGREPDCWRRIVGLGLRSDGTKFGLSAFGLDLFSDVPGPLVDAPTREKAEAHFTRRWASFLAGEPEAGWSLRHGRHHVEREAGRARVAFARFSATGDLELIELVPDEQETELLEAEDKQAVEAAFRAAHQATRTEPERARPQMLLRRAEDALAAHETGARRGVQSRHLRSLSSACQVSFEPMAHESGRFVPPDFRFRRPSGCGTLNVVARLAEDFRSVDVWLQIHHVAIDGAPIQELLTRLERTWGVTGPPVFPGDGPANASTVRSVQPSPRDRPLCEVVDFVNFEPLLRWREERNARWRERLGGPVPVVCALLWQLARQPEFAGRKFSTAVDVPPDARRARAVDLMAIRPADYGEGEEGFGRFAQDYIALVAKARVRATVGYQTMRGLALLPPWLAARALAVDAERGRRIFGTVGLSMLKDARVFSAPMEDAGWYQGFLAIGNVSLPARGGGTVAVVTARGAAEEVRHYPQAIRRAVQACAADK